jgi:hypothetical protein
MPYTPPNVVVAGTPVDATALQGNTSALRLYLNRGIVLADIPVDSVTTTDLVRGEFVAVVPDHLFTTGDLYTTFVDENTYDYDYFTSHFKAYDLYSTKLQPVPVGGKRIVMEDDGFIVMSIGMHVQGDENYELTPQKKASGVYVRISLNDRVVPTDTRVASFGRVYTEDDVAADVDNSGALNVDGFAARRWYCQRYRFPASKGAVVNITVAIDPRCDKMWVGARNVNFEVFYR